MATRENTTAPTTGDLSAYLSALTERRRADATRLVELLGTATGRPPVLWGSSIVGFGTRHYRYPSGREGDTPAVGFALRSTGIALYPTGDLGGYADLLPRLGRCTAGKGCLRLEDLTGVDERALAELATRSLAAAG